MAPCELLFPEAARLRAAWRIASGEPRAGDEALAIIDELLTRRTSAGHYLARAEAARLAGRTEYAWASLLRFADLLPGEQARPLAPRALEVARTLEARSSSSMETIERLERAAGSGARGF